MEFAITYFSFLYPSKLESYKDFPIPFIVNHNGGF